MMSFPSIFSARNTSTLSLIGKGPPSSEDSPGDTDLMLVSGMLDTPEISKQLSSTEVSSWNESVLEFELSSRIVLTFSCQFLDLP